MSVTAKLNYLRIAPRKVRLVADLIRGKKAGEAETILSFVVKMGSIPLLKLLKSALANARNNFHLEAENLYIAKITVDEGPKYKRWMPRARGSADQIQKKTSHITLILEEVGSSGKIKKTTATAPTDEKPKTAVFEKAKTKGYREKKISKVVSKPKPAARTKQMFRRKAI